MAGSGRAGGEPGRRDRPFKSPRARALSASGSQNRQPGLAEFVRSRSSCVWG